jgi:hypothetical protein
MDLHPLVVHYPIAFLTTYAVFEIFRVKRLTSLPYCYNIKVALVILGEISAIVTLILATVFAGSTTAGGGDIVEKYRIFMVCTVLIFGLISLAYIKNWQKVLNPKVIIPLSIIGLFFIIVSGGLYGATVFGIHFDPFLAPVFRALDLL